EPPADDEACRPALEAEQSLAVVHRDVHRRAHRDLEVLQREKRDRAAVDRVGVDATELPAVLVLDRERRCGLAVAEVPGLLPNLPDPAGDALGRRRVSVYARARCPA